jgi:hypothetical protein
MRFPVRAATIVTALLAVGIGVGHAQSNRSETTITVRDENGRRHIVVKRDGVTVRDEWITAKDAGRYRVDAPTIVYGRDRDGRVSRVRGVQTPTVIRQKDLQNRILRRDERGTTYVTPRNIEVPRTPRAPISRGRIGEIAAPPMVISRDNIEQLLNSMTSEQKARQDRRGYLTLDDLTPAQRHMFNAPKGDNWNIVYEIDGKKIALRSK